VPPPRPQELRVSRRAQVESRALALVRNLLGLHESLAFTERRDGPCPAESRRAELGHGPQRFPPREAQAAAHGSGHRQGLGLSVTSQLASGHSRNSKALRLQSSIFLLEDSGYLTFYFQCCSSMHSSPCSKDEGEFRNTKTKAICHPCDSELWLAQQVCLSPGKEEEIRVCSGSPR